MAWTPKEKEAYFKKFSPLFDFEVKFFILDKCKKHIMAVREEDKYEYKGEYFAYYGSGKCKQWPACVTIQRCREYSPDLDFTKDEAEAILYAWDNQHLPDSESFCLPRTRIEDFPVY